MSQLESVAVEPSRSSPFFEAEGLSRSQMGLALMTGLVINAGNFRKGPERWIATGYVTMFLGAGYVFYRMQRALARVDRAAVLFGSQLRHYTTSRSVRWLSERLEQCRRYLTTLL